MNDWNIKEIISELTNSVAAQSAIKAAQYVLSEQPIQQRYLSTKQAARYLGLSVDVLQLWRAQERGPKFIRIYRAVRYDTQYLDRWMSGLTVGLDGTFIGIHSNDRDRREQ